MAYTRLDQRLHVIKRSDTYVGSKNTESFNMYVVDDLDKFTVDRKVVNHNPAFIKLFDEILVNASDQAIRTGKVSYIKIKIDDEKISVENDGPSIPISYWYDNIIHFLKIKSIKAQGHNFIIDFDYDENFTEESASILSSKVLTRGLSFINTNDTESIYTLKAYELNTTTKKLTLLFKEEIKKSTISALTKPGSYFGNYTTRIYNPELIFGHLLTGENYDDNDDKVVGGRNGLGAKLANIFSTKFIVECCDGKHKYKQVFSDNMSNIDKPSITTHVTTSTYTRITYYPDFSKFDMSSMTADLKSIMYKRVLDVAVYNSGVKISINNKTVPVRSIKDWMSLHVGDKEFFYETLDNGWDVGISSCEDGGFEQVSVVNGISTHRGGAHVNTVALQLSKDILEKLPKTLSNKFKHNDIKNRIFMFMVAKVPNPIFDTQTKEYLSSAMSKQIIGDSKVSEKTVKKILKSSIIDNLIQEMKIKEQMELNKLSGTKSKKVRVNKLVDANKAGSSESHKCSLFLAEGDSATSMAISGFSIVGRDYYGVFPLKGKPMNVRRTDMNKIRNNDEIIGIITALGLEFGKKYTNLKDLRYGKCVIFSDADNDGIHIKALLINMFEFFWSELLKLDFLFEFITPILKARKGKESISFYTQKDYDKWLSKSPIGYKIKYYKGLGTSTPEEGKAYFKSIDSHLLAFDWDTDDNKERIELVFSDKREDDRKKWLLGDLPQPIDKYGKPTPISSFMDNEMKLFSIADNKRSIPNLMDGLKPSQRKALYASFKKNLSIDNEVTVASLGAYAKENTKYHHGEKSMEDTIVNMSQDFIGSNNLPILFPSGAFGTRLMGGKDAASSRYIHSFIHDYTRDIFLKADDDILEYLDEDGYKIEPEIYSPIIPMVLVNGAEGIGTGWSCNIPKYNPKDLIKYIKDKFTKKRNTKLKPFYSGFTGDIVLDKDNTKDTERYIVYGKYEVVNTTKLRITELPIGAWTNDYKEHLNKLVDDKVIKEYIDQGTDNTVNIEIFLSREELTNITKDRDKFISTFKLSSYINLSNMYLFLDNKIKKYDSPEEIMEAFIDIRTADYIKRKKSLSDNLTDKIKRLSNQARFIQMVIKGELVINNRGKDLIVKDLVKHKFDTIDDNHDYLLIMPIYSLTKEKFNDLKQKLVSLKADMKLLASKSVEDLWLEDLDILVKRIPKM